MHIHEELLGVAKKNHPTSSTKSAALLYEEDWRITNENSRMSKDELMVDAKKSRKSNLPRCLPLYHQEIEVVRTHNAYQIGTSTTSMSSTVTMVVMHNPL